MIDSFRPKLFGGQAAIHIMRDTLVPLRTSRELAKAATLKINVQFSDKRRFVVWNFMVHVVLSDYLYAPDDIHEPIVGLSWHGFDTNHVLTLWFTRCHQPNSPQDMYYLSRIIYFIASCLPDDVRGIMHEDNLVYSKNANLEFFGVEFE